MQVCIVDLFMPDALRQYLTQARQETVSRLLDKIYIDDVPSRWWLAFSKRKL